MSCPQTSPSCICMGCPSPSWTTLALLGSLALPFLLTCAPLTSPFCLSLPSNISLFLGPCQHKSVRFFSALWPVVFALRLGKHHQDIFCPLHCHLSPNPQSFPSQNFPGHLSLWKGIVQQWSEELTWGSFSPWEPLSCLHVLEERSGFKENPGVGG